GEIVAQVEFRLRPRAPDEIKEVVAGLQAQRKASQPTNKRTFGSVFKNPEHDLSAGRMLETCGLKGHRIGGAQISPRHANFIENADGARSEDARELMVEARRRAREQFGVELEDEVAPPAVATHVRAALAPLEGTSLLALHRADVERRLVTLTDVATASYDRSFPHTLRVVVRAEDPVAVARRGARAWLVSGEGRVMAPAATGTQRALPRIWLMQSGEPEVGAALVDHQGIRAVQALATARSSGF